MSSSNYRENVEHAFVEYEANTLEFFGRDFAILATQSED